VSGASQPVHRRAIVTGGASGMGAAPVARLRAGGVEVAVLDVAGDPPVDVSDAGAVEAAVARVRDELGAIDIVVNAAGIGTGGTLDDPAYPATWARTLAVNLTGARHVVRACLDDLLASGAGRIVNVASTEGLVAARRTSPYTVSKHGLIGFTRSLAVDFGRRGLTANAVCPGPIVTGMTAAIPEAARDEYARRHVPAGRYGRPEEVAHVIVALTALEASYVNGAVITVDGGMTATG
jgi:3-oxoacyl-[acyl-carrier protein] reductase